MLGIRKLTTAVLGPALAVGMAATAATAAPSSTAASAEPANAGVVARSAPVTDWFDCIGYGVRSCYGIRRTTADDGRTRIHLVAKAVDRKGGRDYKVWVTNAELINTNGHYRRFKADQDGRKDRHDFVRTGGLLTTKCRDFRFEAHYHWVRPGGKVQHRDLVRYHRICT